MNNENELDVAANRDIEVPTRRISEDTRTTYLETIMHLLKGNIGTGIFAMGDAFKNAGILTGAIMTVLLGVICTYSAHILINCANCVQDKCGIQDIPDYAQTVEYCFEHGPTKLQNWCKVAKSTVNSFLCVTQLGFCCVYIVFIASNVHLVSSHFDFEMDVRLWMLVLLVPIWLPCLITNLKYLVPFSTIANVCMTFGIGVTMYYSFQDLPKVGERKQFSSFEQLPLFFGTAIFAFEGICLVLPLKNQMKRPSLFESWCGVLNVGMGMVIFCYMTVGFVGYLKYGEDVKGSLSLNLPREHLTPKIAQIAVAIGILFTYTIQFFIALQVLWPIVRDWFNFDPEKLSYELIFRSLIVFLTFIIAEAVPHLGIFISLIGSVSATALALVFPPISELVIAFSSDKGRPSIKTIVINAFILILAVLGFLTGTYEAIRGLVNEFSNEQESDARI